MGLIPARRIFRAEMDFYVDAFLKHQRNNVNTTKKKISLMQAWNAFIRNGKDIGREAWLQKLNAARVQFEISTPTDAKFNLHRLFREVGLP